MYNGDRHVRLTLYNVLSLNFAARKLTVHAALRAVEGRSSSLSRIQRSFCVNHSVSTLLFIHFVSPARAQESGWRITIPENCPGHSSHAALKMQLI
jgi:hypothetical protein